MAKNHRDPTAPRTHHDALFKRIFGNPQHAAEELRAVLPVQVVRHIDWSTLSLDHANLLGDGFKQYYGDLLFSTRLAKASADARGRRRKSRPKIFIWTLFEHQSTVDHWMAMRMVDMKLALWHRIREHSPGIKQLPVVLSVVFYQGSKPWNAPRSLFELIDLPDDVREDFRVYLPSGQLVLDDIVTVSDEDIQERDMHPYPKLGLVVFKHGSSPDLGQHLARFGSEIQTLLATEHGWILFQVLLSYTWEVNPDIDMPALGDYLEPFTGQKIQKVMLSYADKLKREGLEKGLEKGLAKGREQELRAILLQQLAQRFGTVSKRHQSRIARAKTARLRRWVSRVIAARSLDDVFAG